MSTGPAPRRARYYTCARRFPWVMGKIADWRLPLGPYNAAQIALATGGGFVLVKAFALWGGFGPLSVLPVAAWIVGIWLLRRPKIGGRTPVAAALGLAALAVQPAGGRVGRRAARDRPACWLSGGCGIEGLPRPGDQRRGAPAWRATRPGRHAFRPRGPRADQPPSAAPTTAVSVASVSPVRALLEQAQLRAQHAVMTKEE